MLNFRTLFENINDYVYSLDALLKESLEKKNFNGVIKTPKYSDLFQISK